MKLPLPKAPAHLQQRPQKKGKHAASKQHSHSQNPQQLQQFLQQTGQAFREATARGDYAQAHDLVKSVLRHVPQHPNANMDLAYTELRLQRYAEAYQHYHQAIQYFGAQVDTNLYDGLAEVCYYLNKPDELQRYGAMAIQTKLAQVANLPLQALPANKPPAFDGSNPNSNIISYSLFGDSPRYCEVAIENVRLAKILYPQWMCRFYVDDTVPTTVKQRLLALGAQVLEVTSEQQQMSGLFWRFLVMDDPSVQRFLIRDADSLLSYREQAAVQQWLASEQWFQAMRDYYSHTELILAGMWGGCTGVFHNIHAQVLAYQAQHSGVARVIDQHFLRFCIWPTLQQSLLTHDRYGFAPQSVAFPSASQQFDFEQHPQFHVGMNFGSSLAEVAVQDATASQVEWRLFDEHDQLVCAYISPVLPNRKIQIWLPQNYADHLSSKAWKLQVHPLQNSN